MDTVGLDLVVTQQKRTRLFRRLSNLCFSLAAIMFIAIIVLGFMNNPLAFFALFALVIFAMLGLVFQLEATAEHQRKHVIES